MSKNEHFPVANGAALVCNGAGCDYKAYVGEAAITRGASGETPLSDYFGHLWRTHAHQFEPGSAPDITVEWELVASCSVCPEGGEMEMVDDSVQCQTCFSSWNDRGEWGETDPDTLEEIRENDHEEAISHVEWLIAGRDNRGGIRMRSGRADLVANAEDSREGIQGWLDRSRPGRYRDMYRAALDLLDREAAAEFARLAAVPPLLPDYKVEELPDGSLRVEDFLSGAPAMRYVEAMARRQRERARPLEDLILGFDGASESTPVVTYSRRSADTLGEMIYELKDPAPLRADLWSEEGSDPIADLLAAARRLAAVPYDLEFTEWSPAAPAFPMRPRWERDLLTTGHWAYPQPSERTGRYGGEDVFAAVRYAPIRATLGPMPKLTISSPLVRMLCLESPRDRALVMGIVG